MSAPYGYASWNYGYTLCPETGSQYYQPPVVPVGVGYVPRGRGGGRGNHFARGGPRGGGGGYPVNQKPVQTEIKPEVGTAVAPAPADVKPVVAVKEEKEEGEIVDRPLAQILRGRNAIMFCNDQAKFVSFQLNRFLTNKVFPYFLIAVSNP